jgi:hypothetical protein
LYHAFNLKRQQDAPSERALLQYGVRNRGGWRTAVDITILQASALGDERIVQGHCVGVVVTKNTSSCNRDAGTTDTPKLFVVLVDTSGSEELSQLYPPLVVGVENGPELEGKVLPSLVEGEPPFRFFAPAMREPLPLRMDVALAAGVAEGDLVQCQAVMDPGVSRQPLTVTNLQVLQRGSCPKVTAWIAR